jgi:NADH-quinone oxidoreductase subunit A
LGTKSRQQHSGTGSDARREVDAAVPQHPSATASLRAPCAAVSGSGNRERGDTGARLPSTQPNAERTEVLAEYLPTLLFLIVASGIGIALIVIGNFLGPKRFDPEKLSPYECGFNAFEDARMRFDVRYYLIAILFIVFDLEIAFVYPWALVFRELGVFGLIEMGIFLGLLLIGFIYVWKKGALEWE